MSQQENVELAKQVYAAFTQGDIPALLALFSDEAEFIHPMSTTIWPWAGKRRGREQMAELFAGLAEVLEFERFEPQEFIAQGDKVVVLMFERFRVKATGRRLDNEYVHVLTASNGKVIQFRVYEDTAPIIAAIRDRDTI